MKTESYLTFKLDNELFAVNVSRVLEILEMRPVTKIPKSLPFMRGIINLRGNILPVIDTRVKFGMAPVDYTIDTCIIVLNINTNNESFLAGAIVDSVQKVLDIPAESIQPSANITAVFRKDFISGVGKADDNFIMILNIDNVFSPEEVSLIKGDNLSVAV